MNSLKAENAEGSYSISSAAKHRSVFFSVSEVVKMVKIINDGGDDKKPDGSLKEAAAAANVLATSRKSKPDQALEGFKFPVR